MLSRTEFRERTKLSRKALRVYEGKGMLTPQKLPGGGAHYCEADVERARFISTLRAVGLSLSVISQLLKPETCADGVLRSEIKRDLSRLAEQASAAINLIETYSRKIQSEIHERRYGGFWTLGVERDLKKS